MIVVTGANGFVGGHMVKRLLTEGKPVIALIRTSADLNNLESIKHSDLLTIERTDGSVDSMLDIFQNRRPETILHFASCYIAEHQKNDVDNLIDSNVRFGSRLLEAASISGIRYFINTGTMWQHFNSDAYDPVSLYAATKEAFGAIMQYYATAFPIKCCTLKLTDVYGPYDYRKKLFWLLRQTSETGKPLIMSPGEQILDLVHVHDVTSAYLMALEWLNGSDSKDGVHEFVVRSGERYPLKKLVDIYQENFKKKVSVKWGGRPYRKREVMNPWTGGETVPGWQPVIDLRTGLKMIGREGI